MFTFDVCNRLVTNIKSSTHCNTFVVANKRDHLIELQDNSQRMQQDQMQEEVNLQLLEEQEQSIRRLEVHLF